MVKLNFVGLRGKNIVPVQVRLSLPQVVYWYNNHFMLPIGNKLNFLKKLRQIFKPFVKNIIMSPSLPPGEKFAPFGEVKKLWVIYV